MAGFPPVFETRSPQTSLGEREPKYRPEIDGLRAVAVISVILNHLLPHVLPGGYLGVDIFFVISGYVITSSLESKSEASIGDFLLGFYSRRVRRLLPALLTMVLLASVLIRLFDADPRVSIYTGFLSIFGMANIFLYLQATNYFGVATQRNMFAHTWSLGIEEQFYLLYPILLQWRRPKAPTSFRDDRFRVILLGAISTVSLLLFVLAYHTNQPSAYFLMPCRFWELGIGCLIALISNFSRQKGIGVPVGLLSASAIGLGSIGLILGNRFAVESTILVVIATAVVIAFARSEGGLQGPLSMGPLVYLGKISYSLYLWHWVVICASFWTIGIHIWTVPLQLVIIFVVSAGSYHYIEKPLRRTEWAATRRGVLALAVCSMVIAGGAIFVMQEAGIPRFSGDTLDEISSYKDSPLPGYVTKYTHRKADDCFATQVFARGSNIRDNLTKCTAGNGRKLKLFFVGDSHALDLLPMSDRIYLDGKASVTNVFQPGCRLPPIKSDPPECAYNLKILREIARDPAVKKVLVIRQNYSPRRINGDLARFSRGFESFLAQAAEANIDVVYVLPAPIYYSIDALCTSQWFRPAWAMGNECRDGFREDKLEQLARRRDVTDYMLKLSQTRTNLLVFDPFEVLCGPYATFCTPFRNGRSVYRDSTHLTAEGSELLAKPFERFLKEHDDLIDAR